MSYDGGRDVGTSVKFGLRGGFGLTDGGSVQRSELSADGREREGSVKGLHGKRKAGQRWKRRGGDWVAKVPRWRGGGC